MIEVFKIINNMYSTVSVPVLSFATSSVTRGNSFKLKLLISRDVQSMLNMTK